MTPVVLKSLSRMAGILTLAPVLATGGSNLVVNGDFECTNDHLYGWTYKYETGNAWYASNHLYVAVSNLNGSQQHVLILSGIWAGMQGVMVDSDPIPMQPGGKYKLTVSAHSTGTDCRILIEGYRWRPGIKPHPNPKLTELRKCYRFTQVYFGPVKAGTHGNVGPTWTRASQTFPENSLSPLAQESFNKVQFLVVHIVAIGNSFGTWASCYTSHLYVDEVVLERLN